MAMLMWNPIIGLVYNEKLQRWHPIVYHEAPLPGGSGPVRHKSTGHHTEGFATREEAIAGAKTLAEAIIKEQCSDVPPKLVLDEDMLWNGEDVPASVAFFLTDSDGKTKRVM